jgi:hypothetical protein
MNSACAEVLGSSSTRLENPADKFGGQSGLIPELEPKNGSAEEVSSEALDRRGLPTENTPHEQSLGAAQEFRSSSLLTAKSPETQNRDCASTGTPHEFVSVTENKTASVV